MNTNKITNELYIKELETTIEKMIAAQDWAEKMPIFAKTIIKGKLTSENNHVSYGDKYKDMCFGWGINRYDQAFSHYNKIQPAKIERLNFYNNKDGTNNLVKIVVELGIFSTIFFLFCFLFLINNKISIELKLFYLPFIITQSIRGAGYFNGGFLLIVFIMLFTYISVYKKNS